MKQEPTPPSQANLTRWLDSGAAYQWVWSRSAAWSEQDYAEFLGLIEGAWERIHRAMREQARHQAGQETMPSVMISEEPVGQDHSKRSVWLRRPPIGDGSKRHLLVDVQGIVLKVVVSAASDAGPRVGAASGPRAAAVQTTSASPAP